MIACGQDGLVAAASLGFPAHYILKGQRTIRNGPVVCLLIEPICSERIRDPRMTWLNQKCH